MPPLLELGNKNELALYKEIISFKLTLLVAANLFKIEIFLLFPCELTFIYGMKSFDVYCIPRVPFKISSYTQNICVYLDRTT